MRSALVMCVVASLGCVPRARPADPIQWNAARRDCQRGAPDACLWVGVSKVQQGDYVGAKKLFIDACDSGIVAACSQLAHAALYGRGEPKDFERALTLAKRACEQGNGAGCHLAGIVLYRRVNQDLAASTAYYARACAAEEPESCRDYGRALNEGRGVPVDVARARALWRKTCPSDDSACSLLADSLHDGGETATGLSVAQEGCTAGGDASCGTAGELLSKQGDKPLAARYLRTACAWGHKYSCSLLASLLVQMNPQLIDEADLVWSESCRRGDKRDCYRLAEFRMTRTGRTEGEIEKIDALCKGGLGEACGWLCDAAQKDPTAATCKSACKLGIKASCVADQ